MQGDHFINKSYCEFIIVSEIFSPEIITGDLDIQPTRFFCKGDLVTSKHSARVGSKQHNLWAIKTETSISEEESISSHIKQMQIILNKKINILGRYKTDPTIETIFWIWIETQNAGIGLDLKEEELFFLNTISNRIHFSFITNI